MVSVYSDLTIHCDGYEAIGFDILELNNSMSVTGKLSPATWLLGILFDGRVLTSIHNESYSLEVLCARVPDGQGTALNLNTAASHHLRGDGRKECSFHRGIRQQTL